MWRPAWPEMKDDAVRLLQAAWRDPSRRELVRRCYGRWDGRRAVPIASGQTRNAADELLSPDEDESQRMLRGERLTAALSSPAFCVKWCRSCGNSGFFAGGVG